MQVQTESEERAALAYELGWLSKAAHDVTGNWPRVIAERVEGDGFSLNAMSAREIADLCRAIREEFPSLDLGTP